MNNLFPSIYWKNNTRCSLLLHLYWYLHHNSNQCESAFRLWHHTPVDVFGTELNMFEFSGIWDLKLLLKKLRSTREVMKCSGLLLLRKIVGFGPSADTKWLCCSTEQMIPLQDFSGLCYWTVHQYCRGSQDHHGCHDDVECVQRSQQKPLQDPRLRFAILTVKLWVLGVGREDLSDWLVEQWKVDFELPIASSLDFWSSIQAQRLCIPFLNPWFLWWRVAIQQQEPKNL